MSFHLSTNCVRNEIGKLKLGHSPLKEGALEDAGGPHTPYWQPRENVASTLSIRLGQRLGSGLSAVACERPLLPTTSPYQTIPR